MASAASENGDLPSPSPSSVFSPLTPLSPFSPNSVTRSNVHGIRTFSFENGYGSEVMNKEELKHVEAVVYERYIRDLKGIRETGFFAVFNYYSFITTK